MFIIQLNNGFVRYTDNAGEAKFYAMLSLDYCLCNVYRRGSMQLLSQYDFS